MLDLSPLDSLIVEPGTKGLPAGAAAVRLGDIGRQGWRLHEDLVLPAAILRRSALDNNSRWMRGFTERLGVALCPHGKTTMAPQLFDRQLRDGAWGLTCATFAQLIIYRRFKVPRILFANQIVDPAAARWIAAQLAADPDFDFLIFVDSLAGAELLSQAMQVAGGHRRMRALVEIGIAGGRTGVRNVDEALALARGIAALPGLAVAGVATFEGMVGGGSLLEMEPKVDALFATTVAAAEAIAAGGLFAPGEIILSAGGSRFFDIAARALSAADLGRPVQVVLRSGCYFSHDAHQHVEAFRRILERSGESADAGGLVNALEVWADVQSRPEPDWLFANLGRRDISFDVDLPVVIGARGADGSALPHDDLTVRKLSDQHIHVALPGASPLGFGDRLAFGVSHPCTTFDKWQVLYEIDDEDRVVDAIATFF